MLKLFSRKPKVVEHVYANDLVGCIGKVPIHREFIKHRVVSAEVANLDQWYQSAFNLASRELNGEFKRQFVKMPRYSFIYTSPASQQPLIGSIYPSADLSGRCYPCVFFRSIENPVAHEFQMLMPVLYQDYFSATDELFKSAQSNIELPELFQSVNHLNQTVTSLARKQALQVAIDALHDVRIRDVGIENLDQVLTCAITAILSLKHRSDDTLQGLRLPLSGGELYISSVIFWLQILDVLLVDKSNRWQIYWNSAALTVYFRPIPPAFFMHLLKEDDTVPGLIDVASKAMQLETIPEQISVLCSDADLSLMRLSQKLTDQTVLRELK